MKKPNKYNYLRVIQQNYGQGWEDVSEYETDSTFTKLEMLKGSAVAGGIRYKFSLLSHDLKEYKLMGYPTRVINRKELNTVAV